MKAWLTGFKWLNALTIGTLVIMVAYGLVITLFELKPFWLDEWFIIYNLKFKTSAALWGQLDMVQQFPRVYLQIIKFFTAQCNYSYTSLRLPSFIVHSIGLVCSYSLSRRLFTQRSPYRFLWILIYASYFTSVHYFVQAKQYTMDMLLAVAAIWQLTELLKITDISRTRYILLCFISFTIPYFSYTYPVCFAPVVLISLLYNRGRKAYLLRSVPVLLTLTSIVIFYFIDVAQVMQDKGMQDYWKDHLMKDGFSISVFMEKVYRLFANMGAGAIFEILYGIMGIAGLLYASIKLTKKSDSSVFSYAVKYSTLLIWLVIALFVLHKLPLGAHRLNAFAVPAAGILIANLLMAMANARSLSRFAPVFSSALAVAASIGILTSFIDQLAGKEALLTKHIYQNLGAGIHLAQVKHLPIATAPGIGYPFEDGEKDWALKTHPAYDVRITLPVYPVKDRAALTALLITYPNIKSIMFIEKEQYSIVIR